MSPAKANNTGLVDLERPGNSTIDSAQLEQQLRDLRVGMEARGTTATLQDVIARGIAANPQLVQAHQRIEEQRWSLEAARRQWNPTLSLQNGQPFAGRVYNYSESKIDGFSDTSDLSQWQLSPGGILSWSFFLPSRGSTIRAADASLRQQQLLFDAAARNLVLALQSSYFKLQASRQTIEDFERLVDVSRKQVEALRAKFAIGVVNIGDVHLATSQLYQQLSSLVASYQQYFDNAADLAKVAGLPPGMLILPADELEPFGEWTLTLGETLEEGLRLREEIQASLASSESSRWEATALFRSTWPSFSLVAYGAYQNLDGSGSDEVGSRGGLSSNATTIGRAVNRNLDWGIGVGFNWTLYDGGISAAKAEASRASSLADQSQAMNDRLEVTQQLESAYGKYSTSQIAIQSAEQGLKAARESQKVAQTRLLIGVGDVSAVVQAMQLTAAAAQEKINAVLAYNQSVAELYRYSAQWPEGTLPLVQARMEALK